MKPVVCTTIILFLIGMSLTLYWSRPYTAKEPLWLPADHMLKNKTGKEFVVLAEQPWGGDGFTASWLSLAEYQKKFANVPGHQVAVLQYGRTEYRVEHDGQVFMTFQSHFFRSYPMECLTKAVKLEVADGMIMETYARTWRTVAETAVFLALIGIIFDMTLILMMEMERSNRQIIKKS